MELITGEKIPTFDHIIDHIYLGDLDSVNSEYIEKNNIEIIINISNSRYDINPVIKYYNYDIEDNHDENISKFFSSFISVTSSTKSNILIHCANSVSRSVTLVLIYLLQHMNLKDALVYLKSKRTQYTKPNIGFIKQLIQYENKLHGSNSITLSEFISYCKI